jgi:hypothetical protein
MPPKTKYLLTDLFLESIRKGQRNDHNGNADNCGYDGQANYEPGKGSLLIKSYAICYKACNLQIREFVLFISVDSSGRKPTSWNKNKLIKIFTCLLNLFLQYCEFISTDTT